MEVTRKNFAENINKIKKYIAESDFFSFDTELTGLYADKSNFFDTPETRYRRSRLDAMKFTITQLGICFFKYDQDQNKFKYAPLNFHIFPTICNESVMNGKCFLTCSSTVEFLNEHKFDFNTCFSDGIRFVRQDDYEQSMNDIDAREIAAIERIKNIDLTSFDFTPLDGIIQDCTDLLNGQRNGDALELSNSIDGYNRYLLFNILWKRVGCISGRWINVVNSKDESNKSIIKITKCSDPEQLKIQETKDYHNKLRNDVEKKFELTRLVLQIFLNNSNKSMVGHNCLLDLFHIYDKFIGDLPPTLNEFKQIFNTKFPKCFDTKFMFGHSKFNNFAAGNLEKLYHLTRQHPFANLDCEPLCDEVKFADGNFYHTAHYDAWTTGMVFVSLTSFLNDNELDLWQSFEKVVRTKLSKFINFFNLVGAEIGKMSLMKSEKVCRKHVFHMTFPCIYNKMDIVRIWSSLLSVREGEMYDSLTISWLGSTSAMVKVPEKYDIERIKSTSYLNDAVTIRTFNEHFGIEEKANNDDGFITVKRSRRE